jgi:hypothetical protein
VHHQHGAAPSASAGQQSPQHLTLAAPP